MENEAKFDVSLVWHRQDARHDPSLRTSLRVSDFGPIKALLRQGLLDFVPTLTADLRMTPFEHPKSNLGWSPTMMERSSSAIDTATGNGSDRMLSAVYYFYAEPKAFTGGALRLYSFGMDARDGNFTDVQPEQNMLLVFPSSWVHEVLPVSCPSKRFSDSRFNINLIAKCIDI
jgi:hypothetical protein